MMSIKGTLTEKNLLISFAGESQARMRYEFFSKIAKEEGYEQIAFIFQKTADEEKEHAKRFFSYLEGGMVEITAMYPAGKLDTTLKNLELAAAGEHEEWSELYPKFSEIAMQEGFKEIATTFKMIASVEEKHEKRYRKLIQNILENKVFEREEKVYWYCRNCGYIHYGTSALEKCPSCLHPKAFFEILCENY
ncbi:MAG: rubrerythrin family protein [Bacteroidales bacterium]|nr:rubrerythrin family protein [Bacteroidales bacterium]